MPVQEKKTSLLKLLLSVVLIGALTVLLSGPAGTSPASVSSSANDVIVADNLHSMEIMGNMLASPAPAENPETGEASDSDDSEESADASKAAGSSDSAEAAGEADSSPVDDEADEGAGLPSFSQPSPYEPSPESREGVWVSQGTDWMFMVDGAAYTGWLNDADGKRYYLDQDGTMHVGWLDVDGKRYYLDQDGIMQTGDVSIGKETYHFFPSGVLDDGSGDIDITGSSSGSSGSDKKAEETKTEVSSAKKKPNPNIWL